MRKTLSLFITSLLVIGYMVALPTASGDDQDTCAVLFDFGNGDVHWADVQVEEGWNAFNATLEGANDLGFTVGYTESEFGVFVYSIDNITEQWPNEYWHFWVWNSTIGQWEMSTAGASTTSLDGLEAIAWSYVEDRLDWSSERPLATPDFRQPWTMFRHDLGNSGMVGIEGPSTPEIRWTLDLDNGAIDSAVVSANGKLYVVTAGIFNWSSFSSESDPRVFCLDTDGNQIWNATYGNAGYQVGSPLIVDGMLIVPSTDCSLYAFSTEDGTELWNYSTGFSYTGVSSSPILYRNQILFGSGDGNLYSLALDGTLLWNTSLASSIYFSSPAAADGIIYIGSEDGMLHAVAANGTGELWNATVGGKVRSAPLLLDEMIVATYAIYEGLVPVDGGVAAFTYDGTGIWDVNVNATSTSAALTPEGIAVTSVDGLTLISTSGEVQWTLATEDPMKGCPTVSDGAIHVTTWGDLTEVIAVQFNGTVMWDTILSPESGNQYSMCSPVLVDSTLYVTADNGYIYAFDDVKPVADFTYEVDGLTVSFNASASHDVQGELQYGWQFGDGNTSTGMFVNHTYVHGGNYTVKLTVIDDEESQDSTHRVVGVTEPSIDEGLNWLLITIIVIVLIGIAGAIYISFRRD